MIQVRRLTATEKTGAIVFYFFILSSGLGPAHPPLRLEHAGCARTLPSSSSAALFGGIGQILVTESYRHADTSVIAPFEYTSMIWALLFGWIVFSDLPTLTVVIGGLIVAASGLLIVWREHRLGLERAKELQAAPGTPQASRFGRPPWGRQRLTRPAHYPKTVLRNDRSFFQNTRHGHGRRRQRAA